MTEGESDTSVQEPRRARLRVRSGVMYSPRTNYVRRIRRETLVLAMGAGWFLLIVGLVVAQALTFRSPLSIPVVIAGSIACVLSNFGLMAFRLVRARRHMESCNWRRCCWCEYDTTPIGETGMCPECGREFSSSLLRADFQSLMDQLGWWMPKRWRTISSADVCGNATTEHAPLRAPKPGAKDYVDRSTSRANAAQVLGMIGGWLVLGYTVRALALTIPGIYQVIALFAFCIGFGLLARMAYMQYRRMRLARRNWNICPWCEHDTRDIGSEGTCPSCGGEFSTADLKTDFDAACRTTAWMFWIRSDEGGRGLTKGPTQ